jgi:uncharacterized protein YkwD
MLRTHRPVPAGIRLLACTAILCSATLYTGTAVPGPAAADAGCSGPAAERVPTAVELELLAVVNAERQARGLSTVTPAVSLMRAARWKANDLAATVSGVITDSDLDDADRNWMMRLLDCGYPDSAAVGETLGQIPGGADADTVLQFWLDSELNRQVLLDPRWRAAGVAAVESGDYTFWVLDLGDTAP